LVALLSTLLIMAAISMLDLRGTGRLEVKIIRGLTKMTEAAKIAISRTEIITIKTKKEAAKGRMTTVPTGRKGLKEGVAREEVLTGEIMLMGKDPKA